MKSRVWSGVVQQSLGLLDKVGATPISHTLLQLNPSPRRNLASVFWSTILRYLLSCVGGTGVHITESSGS